jgi:GTP-binding protein SAR1
LWKEYVTTANAVIFIVDSYDRNRFDEAREELHGILNDEHMRKVPVLVLGNKIDLPHAASELELKNALGLQELTTGKNAGVSRGIRPLEVFMCSITKNRGFGDG